MKPVICFEMLFPGLPPEEKTIRIRRAGFGWIEFWGWRDKDLKALGEVCRKEGMGVANFSGHRQGSLVDAAAHPALLEDLRDASAAAAGLGCPLLMLLTNELGEGGKVKDSYPNLSPQAKFANAREGLRKALKTAPPSLRLVLEPLNDKVDHPGYWLTEMETAVRLVDEVADPRLKILADLYHLGMMGEDLKELIHRHAERIGYIHVADFPGRHEPGTGRAGFERLLAELAEAGYDGCVGFEYQPLQDSEESLTRIQELWKRVFG